MTTINRSDITEEVTTVYVWKCPKCGHVTRDESEKYVKDFAICDECINSFKIIEDAK